MEFCEIIYDKITSSQKTSCRLVVSSFNYFKMHAWSTSMLFLLHSAFMLSVVKLLLKGRLESVLIMENHGKIMELCF